MNWEALKDWIDFEVVKDWIYEKLGNGAIVAASIMVISWFVPATAAAAFIQDNPEIGETLSLLRETGEDLPMWFRMTMAFIITIGAFLKMTWKIWTDPKVLSLFKKKEAPKDAP